LPRIVARGLFVWVGVSISPSLKHRGLSWKSRGGLARASCVYVSSNGADCPSSISALICLTVPLHFASRGVATRNSRGVGELHDGKERGWRRGYFEARTTKVVVRPLEDPSFEDGVANLRIRAYPQFLEARNVEFYSSAYRWFRRHPLGSTLHRWVAIDDAGRVVGHLAAVPQ
jgi:hypothetical protein